jgi:hypothetical protein
MMKSGLYFTLLILTLCFLGCNKTPFDSKICGRTEYLHDAVNKTTEVINHDIFPRWLQQGFMPTEYRRMRLPV